MNEDATQWGDPYRVDPAGHSGHDIGILERWFELPRDRRRDDPRGPAPLARAESDGELLARIGTDAEKWANEFLARLADSYVVRESGPGTGFGHRVDTSPGSDLHATVRAWFANAIGAGESAGYVRGIDHTVGGEPGGAGQ